MERVAESDAGHTLLPLTKVVSPVPVLTPEIRDLATAVAARYAGTLSDVLRVAVPPRVARLEKTFPGLPEPAAGAVANQPINTGADVTGREPWADYRNGPAFLRH